MPTTFSARKVIQEARQQGEAALTQPASLLRRYAPALPTAAGVARSGGTLLSRAKLASSPEERAKAATLLRRQERELRVLGGMALRVGEHVAKAALNETRQQLRKLERQGEKVQAVSTELAAEASEVAQATPAEPAVRPARKTPAKTSAK